MIRWMLEFLFSVPQNVCLMSLCLFLFQFHDIWRWLFSRTWKENDEFSSLFFPYWFYESDAERERKRKRDWKKNVCKRTSWERMQTVCHKAIEWLGFSMHPILPSTSMHGGLNAIFCNVKCITLWRDAVLTGFSFSPRQHGVQYNFWSLDRNGQIFV